jgi:stage II sporulation protein D
MRRFSLLLAALAALVFVSSAGASTLFVIKGKGWGHGVGMSQWGAQGKALRGVAYQHILHFYYQPATLGSAGESKVRVLLASGRSSVRISSDSSFSVGNKKLAGNTSYSVVPAADGKVRVVGVGKFANPATATPGNNLLRLNGARYRGSFKLWVQSGKIAVVNVVGLQAYLFSVVPREMPSWFHVEALKAQAVAARSYAVRAHRSSWFDLYANTYDQVYGGYESGEPASAVAAVRATKGKVMLYGGQVAQTYFSSSNGGVEAASVDTWGGNLPYLQSRPDPDDLTPGNPNRSWKLRLRPSRLGNKLGTPSPRDAAVASWRSGRVNSISASGSGWSQVVTGGPEHFRFALGLKSSRFWLGVQSLNTNRTLSRCRKAVKLSIFAHGVGDVALYQRPVTGTSWTAVALTAVDAKHWTVTRRPCVSMDYRVVSDSAGGPSVHVAVAPDIAFDAVQHQGALTGKVNPLLTGTSVRIQKRSSTGWHTVALTTIKSDGSFRAEFNVAAGRYRAKVVPPSSTGLVTGFSPVLEVVT